MVNERTSELEHGSTGGKGAEETLQESGERFRRIFEEGPLGMCIVDQGFRFAAVNSTLCEMLGYTEQELTALTFPEVTHPDDIDLDVQLARQVFNGEIPHCRIEKRYITKNQEIKWISLTASVIRDKDGNVLYGLGMIEDITERKRAEEDLQLRNRELESLFNITSILTQPRRFEEKITDVVGELLRVAEADSVTLRVPDEREGGLRLVTSSGDKMFSTPPLVQHSPKGLSVAAFEDGIPMVANDYPSLPNAEASAVADGAKSMIALPVKSGEQTLGVVTVVSREFNHFTSDRVGILTAIADGLAVPLECWQPAKVGQFETREIRGVKELG